MPRLLIAVIRLVVVWLAPIYCHLSAIRLKQRNYWELYYPVLFLSLFVEALFDMILSWLPLYEEFKLGFFIYLAFPTSQGYICVFRRLFPAFVKVRPHIELLFGHVILPIFKRQIQRTGSLLSSIVKKIGLRALHATASA